MSNRVQACLASITTRAHRLDEVISSLLPQVDRVCVYLNGYHDELVPRLLREHERVVVERSSRFGDRGDAGKFWWSDKWDGYCLTCDDDFIYPPDYADKMVAAVERFGRKAAVGIHGMVVDDTFVSYYLMPRPDHWKDASSEYRAVNILGTGALAYHTSTLPVAPDDFELPNMADVWFALLCQRHRVPCLTIPRPAAWLRALPVRESIYDRYLNDDEQQTVAVRRTWPWDVFEVSK